MTAPVAPGGFTFRPNAGKGGNSSRQEKPSYDVILMGTPCRESEYTSGPSRHSLYLGGRFCAETPLSMTVGLPPTPVLGRNHNPPPGSARPPRWPCYTLAGRFVGTSGPIGAEVGP